MRLHPLPQLALGLLVATSACASPPESPHTEDETRIESGAFLALTHWGRSRAYPEKHIPDDAFMRAYERNERKKSRLKRRGMLELQADDSQRLTWEPLGPINGGGRTLTLAFDPTNPSTMYAGSAGGGLWRTTTGGIGATAWERVDTGHPVLGVSTIAFAPDDPNVMYIGTGEVYNHQNAGDLAADRATRGSYGIGILKSTDGGATWTKSLDWSYRQRHGVWAVRVDPGNANVVWAATTDGVYKSTNAGATWNQVMSTIMANDLVIHPTDTDTVLVGCGNLSSAGGGIYRTTNGGTSWSQITGGGIPGSFNGKIQFGVTVADEDLVYASIGDGFSTGSITWLLRSTNFGSSFTLQNTTDYAVYQGWFAHDVAVSPVDPDLVVCIGVDAWKSTNAGVTLNRQSLWFAGFDGQIPAGGPEGPANYSHADHHDVIFHPTDPDVVYYANDGGVFRSDDAGDTFAGANGGMQTQQFYNGAQSYDTDPNLAIGGLQDNNSVIYRGTGEWQRGVLGGDGGWAAFDPVDPDIVYATAQNLYVGRSSNGGVSFSNNAPGNPGGAIAFICPLVIAPTDRETLYGGTAYFHRTTNSASSWSLGNNGNQLDGNPILVMDVSHQDADVVYLATAPFSGRGHVYRTQNGGNTFSDLTGSLPDRYPGDVFVDPNDDSIVYLTLSGFGSSHVFKSTNSGGTWTDIDRGALPDVPSNAVTIDPLNPDHVYVGNDIGVFFTYDGGDTWLQIDDGISEAVMVFDLNVSPLNRKLRIFTHGQGAFQTDLYGGSPFEPRPAPKRVIR